MSRAFRAIILVTTAFLLALGGFSPAAQAQNLGDSGIARIASYTLKTVLVFNGGSEAALDGHLLGNYALSGLQLDDNDNIMFTLPGGSFYVSKQGETGYSARFISSQPVFLSRNGHQGYLDNLPRRITRLLVIDGRVIAEDGKSLSGFGDAVVTRIADIQHTCDGGFAALITAQHPNGSREYVAASEEGTFTAIPASVIATQAPQMNGKETLSSLTAHTPRSDNVLEFNPVACNGQNHLLFYGSSRKRLDYDWGFLISNSDGSIYPALGVDSAFAFNDNGMMVTRRLAVVDYAADAKPVASQSLALFSTEKQRWLHSVSPPMDAFPSLLGLSKWKSSSDPYERFEQMQAFLTNTGVAANDHNDIAFLIQKPSFVPAKPGSNPVAIVLATPGGKTQIAQTQPTACPFFLKMQGEAKQMMARADVLATDGNAYALAVTDMQDNAYATDDATHGLNIAAEYIDDYFSSAANIQAHRAEIVANIRAKAAYRTAIAEAGLGQNTETPISQDSISYFCPIEHDPAKLTTTVWNDLYNAGYVDYQLHQDTWGTIYSYYLSGGIAVASSLYAPGTMVVKAAFVKAGSVGVLQVAEELSVTRLATKLLPEAVGDVVDAQIPWGVANGVQGEALETFLTPRLATDGYSFLGKFFKTFDYWNKATKTAISAKTLNTVASSYQRAGSILSRLKGYVDKTLVFEKDEENGFILTKSMIEKRVINLAVPEGTTAAQWGEIRAAMDYASQQGVDLIVLIAP